LANFFSTDWFLDALSRVAFAGSGAQPGMVELEGRAFDVLLLPDGRVAGHALVDFIEERDPGAGLPEFPPSPSPSPSITFLPAVCHRVVPVPADADDSGASAWRVAPFVDWTRFPRWEDYLAFSKPHGTFHKSTRKINKLARTWGPVHVELDRPDHDLLECLLLWKSRQLRRAGRLDRFASVRNRQLLHVLLDTGHMKLSGLFAGTKPVALQLGHADARRHSCWITGYDALERRQSPGTLLFEHMLRNSYDSGQHEFDFLVGDESYKYDYATHQRLIGPLGRETAGARLRDLARTWADPRPGAPAEWLRIRTRAWTSAVWNRGMANQAPVVTQRPAPPWLDLVRAGGPDWPRPHLASPEDCQLQHLFASGPKLQSQVAAVRVAGIQARRLGRAFLVKQQRRTSLRPAAPSAAVVQPPLHLRAGDLVRVHSPAEIAQTLSQGATGGLYYIPQVMDRFGGGTFRVERRVERFYDEREQSVVRPRSTVTLTGVQCDGAQLPGNPGCDRACLLFWSEAWLERATVPATISPSLPPDSSQGSGRFVVGDRVRLRPLDQILARVQAGGDGDGIRWSTAMMAGFAEQQLRVRSVLGTAYDERRGLSRAVSGVVLLEGATCPGVALTGGGICDRCCSLFWREEWLEPA